ncbi:MAG: hypothetical protein ABI895_13500 [Deltaproteobacteria bacterium]
MMTQRRMAKANQELAVWLALSAAQLACSQSAPPDPTSLSDTRSEEARPGTDSARTEEPDEFGSEQTYELRLNDDPPPVLRLDMNRDEVATLFGERAREVGLVEIDLTALLTESLERIKNACGSLWQADNPDPRHDCSLSELGQTFAGPDGRWQTSAEFALVRILTMTPANVDVTGTSSESLRGLADALGIGGGYSQILSDALGIARTAPVVSTAGLVESLQRHFVASHPNVGAEGKLSISLEDALTNLASLAERYGPKGAHPGVLDPSFIPSGAVLGPDFRMHVEATSNLRLCEGIDSDSGKGFLSVVADESGPTFDDALEFDFEDPDKFAITGLVENLALDLRLRSFEAGQFVPSCLGARCQANAPGMPVGNNSVWAIDPWLIEYNIAAGARNDYLARTFAGNYLLGLARISLGQNGAPAGWVTYDVPLGLGSPPEDQYAWETILEVAQVALHRTPLATIPEGEAAVAFTLYDVPVGLTGTEAAQKVRPYLKAQAGVLSDLLLGDYRKNNDAVDFYYRRAETGVPYLFFVAEAEAELKDGLTYLYQRRPGFFRTSELQDKLSSAELPGLSDVSHEKLPISDGETTVYFEGDGGIIRRARIVRAAGSDDLEIHLARKLQ